MKSIYEQLGGTYSQVGDYFLPNNIKLAEMPDSHRPAQREEPFSDAESGSGWIGKYGMIRRAYL